jgi:hypothetical protein
MTRRYIREAALSKAVDVFKNQNPRLIKAGLFLTLKRSNVR